MIHNIKTALFIKSDTRLTSAQHNIIHHFKQTALITTDDQSK